MKASLTFNRGIILLFISFLLIPGLQGQIFVEKGVRPIYTMSMVPISKFADMENFGDVFTTHKALMGHNIFSGNISYNIQRVIVKRDPTKEIQWRNTLSFYTRIHIAEEFSLNTNFLYSFNKKAEAPWTSDFSYSFGRFNWRSNTFSYGYKNYENNHYSDNISTLANKFWLGTFFGSYIHDMPEKLLKYIRIDHTTNIKFDLSLNYAPKYRDINGNLLGGGAFDGKSWSSLAARYTLFRNIYVECAVNYFLNPEHKQPWDPDYVYGFGYFNYRAFRICLTYGNWAVNKFPWNKQVFPDYGFLDGEFRIFINYNW